MWRGLLMPVNEVGVDPNCRQEVYPAPHTHPVGVAAGAVGDGTGVEPEVKVKATDSLEGREACRKQVAEEMGWSVLTGYPEVNRSKGDFLLRIAVSGIRSLPCGRRTIPDFVIASTQDPSWSSCTAEGVGCRLSVGPRSQN